MKARVGFATRWRPTSGTSRATLAATTPATVRVGEEEFKLHLVPSGIVRDGVVCTIGNGVVVNPEVLVEEVEALEEQGLEVGTVSRWTVGRT